jgi:hypothetical protein
MPTEEGRALVEEDIRSCQKILVLQGEGARTDRIEERGREASLGARGCTGGHWGRLRNRLCLAEQGHGHHRCNGSGRPNSDHHPTTEERITTTPCFPFLLIDRKAETLLEVLARAQ